MKVKVIGAGPGDPGMLTRRACEAVAAADRVYTSDHMLKLVEKLTDRGEVRSVGDTLEIIRRSAGSGETLAVVASGDTGFYSIASLIRRDAPPTVDVEFLCGISSMQYFSAACGFGYEEMKLVSLHGREGSLVPFVCYHRRVFALTGGAASAQELLKELCRYGLGNVKVYAGERLSMADETITEGTASELSERGFDPLTVLILVNESPRDPEATLSDRDFVRGKAPMTKGAVRELSLSWLEIRPTETVWDVGAGTGAMTCAMAQRARESFVFAVEKEQEAVETVRRNMDRLGIRNIQLVCGEAPAELEHFPAPDRVFVGGSSGNLNAILDLVFRKNRSARVLITAVTLETLSEAVSALKERGTEPEVRCVNVADARALGRYHLMKAENPVYLIRNGRPAKDEEGPCDEG